MNFIKKIHLCPKDCMQRDDNFDSFVSPHDAPNRCLSPPTQQKG